MAITSKEINLKQLDSELNNYGLAMNATDPKKKVIVVSDNSPITEEELEEAISKHVAEAEAEPSVEEKLASVGLDLEELKAALLA